MSARSGDEDVAHKAFVAQPAVTLREVLRLGPLNEFVCLAGSSGLDRPVAAVSVMDAPDIADWMRGGEILLTTGYALKDNPAAFLELVEALHRKGVAALAIKLKRFHETLPGEVLERADWLGFPLLSIPYNLAWVDIIGPVLSALYEERSRRAAIAEAAVQRLLKALRNGGDVGALADVLSELLACPIGVFDIHGACVAVSSCVSEKMMINGAQLRAVTEEKADLAVVPLEAGGNRCGYLVCWGQVGPTAADLAREMSPILALYVQAKGGTLGLRKQLIVEVLEGNSTGVHERVSEYLKAWGWNAHAYGLVLLLETVSEGEGLARLALWASAELHGLGIVGWAVPVGPRLALVLNVREDAQAFRELCRHLASDSLKGQVRCAAYGRAGPGISFLSESYREALQALDVARRLGISGVVSYKDLGIYRILAPHVLEPVFQKFLQDTLGPLAWVEDDDPLLSSLRVWLECNGNLTNAAAKLHVHYNTLLYRMARIKRMLGIRLDSAEERLNIQVALKVKKLLEGERRFYGVGSGRSGVGASRGEGMSAYSTEFDHGSM